MAIAIRPNHFVVGARPLRVRQRISAARNAASHAEADHVAEGPVGHRDVRRVVAGRVVVARARVLAVLLLVLRAQVVDALDLAVEAAGGEEGQQARDRDRELLATARPACRS